MPLGKEILTSMIEKIKIEMEEMCYEIFFQHCNKNNFFQ